MTIRSRSDRLIVLGALVLCVWGLEILIKALLTNTRIDVVWGVILAGVAYGTYFVFVDFYLSLFKSPIWMELKNSRLSIKMPLRKAFVWDVGAVERVQSKRFSHFWGLNDIRFICGTEKGCIYLRESRYEGLADFIEEMKRANPRLIVDPSVASALSRKDNPHL